MGATVYLINILGTTLDVCAFTSGYHAVLSRRLKQKMKED